MLRSDGDPVSKPRVLYVPMLFATERWNGIMEHLRLLIDGLGDAITPLLVTRQDDGEQTSILASATGVETCALGVGRGAGELRRLCRDRHIDIVHIQTSVSGGMPRLAVGARLGGAHVVVTFQQTQLESANRPRRLLNLVAQRLVLDRCIAVSQSVAESLVALSGFDRSRLDVIYNAVAPYEESHEARSSLELDDSAVWGGYFGRLAEEKDVACLLRALAIASRQDPRLRLLIVGDGYERDRLLALTAQLGLEERAVFTGHRSDARALMRRVAFVVHPPWFEGLPHTLIEALEAGLPIVATRVAGCVEVVDEGSNGLLVAARDAEGLAGAMVTMAGDPAARARYSANARARYERDFTADQMVRSVLDTYMRITSRRGH